MLACPPDTLCAIVRMCDVDKVDAINARIDIRYF